MTRFRPFHRGLYVILSLFLLITSCADPSIQKPPQVQGTVQTPQSFPSITSFSPPSAFPGSVVTVTGANFGNSPSVKISSTPAQVVPGSTETALKFTVPTEARTGNLYITAGTNTVSSNRRFGVLQTKLVQAGGAGNDVPVAVKVGNNGAFLVAGTFNGSASFGSIILDAQGPNDIFVASYVSYTGDVSWAVRVGTAGSTSVTGIASNSGNIYVCGNFHGTVTFGSSTLTSRGGTDGYLLTLKYDGSIISANQIGGPGNDTADAVAIGADGIAIVGGTFEQTINLGTFSFSTNGPETDAYLFNGNEIGSVFWARVITGTGKERVTAIAAIGISEPEGVVVTGTYDHDISLSTSNLAGSGTNNGFVYMLKRNADVIWSQRLFGTGSITPTSIILGKDLKIYVGGTFSQRATLGSLNITSAGKLDIFVGKLNNADGAVLWARTSGGTEDDLFKSIASDRRNDSESNIYFTATFTSTIKFDTQEIIPATPSQNNIVVGRYNSSGDLQWLGQNGPGGSIESFELGVSDSTIWVGSAFSAAPSVQGTTVTSRGQQDILLWRIH